LREWGLVVERILEVINNWSREDTRLLLKGVATSALIIGTALALQFLLVAMHS
jgi:hypothetical protein